MMFNSVRGGVLAAALVLVAGAPASAQNAVDWIVESGGPGQAIAIADSLEAPLGTRFFVACNNTGAFFGVSVPFDMLDPSLQPGDSTLLALSVGSEQVVSATAELDFRSETLAVFVAPFDDRTRAALEPAARFSVRLVGVPQPLRFSVRDTPEVLANTFGVCDGPGAAVEPPDGGGQRDPAAGSAGPGRARSGS